MAESPELLTVAEAAEKLRLTPRGAYKMIARGDFPVDVLRFGRVLRVPRAKLERFIRGEAA